MTIADWSEMAEEIINTYLGHCHCNAFRSSVTFLDVERVTARNCSVCTKLSFYSIPNRINTHIHCAIRLSLDADFVVGKDDATLQCYGHGNQIGMNKIRTVSQHHEPAV